MSADATAFVLQGKIGADTADFDKKAAGVNSELQRTKQNFDQAEKASQSFGSKFQQIGQTLTDFSSKLKAGGAEIRNVGQTLTVGLTLPIVGIGAAVVKLSSDFEDSMSKIAGLTDSSAAEVGRMREQVLSLSKTVPQSAKELADGLFFIVSAGFKGDEAMQVLTISARAAAAGLGETKTVADAVTSTLNAYKLGASDAAHITDILTNAVVQGKMQADTLSGALGRVIPIAAAAHVPFEEVAASLATMTRTGLNADEAATALRGVLAELVKPAAKAKEELEAIGISADELRDSLASKGLLGTLQLLMERTGGNIDALGQIIPNIRALTGVLATAGSQADAYAQILDSMNNAAGRTDKAFQTATKNFSTQAEIFKNKLEAVAITLGERLLPILTPVVEKLGQVLPAAIESVVNWFGRLPSGVQAGALALLGLAAAAGPVLAVVGTIIVAVGSLIGALGTIVSAVGAVAGGIGVVAAAVGGLGPLIVVVVAFGAEMAAVFAAVVAGVALMHAAWDSNFAGIREAVTTAWNAVVPIIQQGWEAIKGFFTKEGGEVVAWVNENWPLIQQTINTVSERIKEIVLAGLALVMGLWKQHGEMIKGIVKAAWDIIKTIIDTGLHVILDLLKIAMQVFNGDWSGAWETFKDILRRASAEVGTILKDLAAIMLNIILGIAKDISDAAQKFYAAALEVGKQIVEGMVAGILGGKSKVTKAAADLAWSAITGTRGTLDSHSPSRVFQQIGHDIADGLVIGIGEGKKAVQDAMIDIATPPAGLGTQEVAGAGGKANALPAIPPTPSLKTVIALKAQDLLKIRFDWKQAVTQMANDGQQAFERFFTYLSKGWRAALKGLALDFIQTLQQMAAQALASQVFGAILKFVSGALMGGGGDFAKGTAMPSAIGKFANGGSFTVGGGGGTDSQLISFMATPGEHVTVSTPGHSVGGDTYNDNRKYYNFNYQPQRTPSTYTTRRGAREFLDSLAPALGR
ncbi:MAG TPA: phage tail tape measure protein [Pyrinomonadaceae bacterium]|nr:phage tail tape measure protein [Pyrinomonadaceae bacterium]